MRYFLVLFLLISIPAFADFYVVNIDNEVIAKCKYQPDTKDLESRNEIVIFSKKDIPLEEVEYRGGKIVKHVKTASEIQEEENKKLEKERHSLIMKRVIKIAKDQLIAEGIIKEEK